MIFMKPSLDMTYPLINATVSSLKVESHFFKLLDNRNRQFLLF